MLSLFVSFLNLASAAPTGLRPHNYNVSSLDTQSVQQFTPSITLPAKPEQRQTQTITLITTITVNTNNHKDTMRPLPFYGDLDEPAHGLYERGYKTTTLATNPDVVEIIDQPTDYQYVCPKCTASTVASLAITTTTPIPFYTVTPVHLTTTVDLTSYTATSTITLFTTITVSPDSGTYMTTNVDTRADNENTTGIVTATTKETGTEASRGRTEDGADGSAVMATSTKMDTSTNDANYGDAITVTNAISYILTTTSTTMMTIYN